jgi:hypothetical protein
LHRCCSSVPFSITPSPLQSGQIFMRPSQHVSGCRATFGLCHRRARPG